MASVLKILRGRLAATTPLARDRTYQLVRSLRDHVWVGDCKTAGLVILKLAKSEDLRKFEREANFQIDFISSKHIRRILDITSAPEWGFKDFEAAMVLEFKPYTLWDACLDPKNSPLSDHQIGQIMEDVLRGLSDMHERGVAHLGQINSHRRSSPCNFSNSTKISNREISWSTVTCPTPTSVTCEQVSPEAPFLFFN
jgi:serine/threonine protein kinase